MKSAGIAALALMTAMTLACNKPNRTSDNTVGTTGVSSSDKSWVENMAVDGMAEVELGNLAKQHASSADVKQFADMMVRDHSKAGNELKQIANDYSIPVPAQLDQKHRDLLDKLSKLQGPQFDKEYMNAMVDGHQDAVSDLEKRADVDRFGKDKGTVTPEKADTHPDALLNQWAANALPVVKHHLDEAKRIKDNLSANRTY